MPAGYEYNLDHRVVDAAAWDIVTLADWERYLEQAATLPNDLRGAVEFVDLSEAVSVQVSYMGAMQLAPYYETFLDRGIRGSVIYVPDEELYEVASMIISTCSVVGGGLPDGYRLTTRPIPLHDVHRFLEQGDSSSKDSVKVA